MHSEIRGCGMFVPPFSGIPTRMPSGSRKQPNARIDPLQIRVKGRVM